MNIHFEEMLRQVLELESTLEAEEICPSNEILLKYVHRELADEDSQSVAEHLKKCSICWLRKIRFEADKVRWETALDEVFVPTFMEQLQQQPPLPQKPIDLREHLAEEIEVWQPLWAGMKVPAADIPEQSHSFPLEDGNIDITCHWKSAYNNRPAHIEISWKAHLSVRVTFWLRFVNPETRKVRFETCLGDRLADKVIFSSYDLGFDPSCEPWAISIYTTQD